VRYAWSWRRPGGSPGRDDSIVWRMTKVGDTWVANR
jgi:hypothetical protein